jgi:hypothetical protein
MTSCGSGGGNSTIGVGGRVGGRDWGHPPRRELSEESLGEG